MCAEGSLLVKGSEGELGGEGGLGWKIGMICLNCYVEYVFRIMSNTGLFVSVKVPFS